MHTNGQNWQRSQHDQACVYMFRNLMLQNSCHENGKNGDINYSKGQLKYS